MLLGKLLALSWLLASTVTSASLVTKDYRYDDSFFPVTSHEVAWLREPAKEHDAVWPSMADIPPGWTPTLQADPVKVSGLFKGHIHIHYQDLEKEFSPFPSVIVRVYSILFRPFAGASHSVLWLCALAEERGGPVTPKDCVSLNVRGSSPDRYQSLRGMERVELRRGQAALHVSTYYTDAKLSDVSQTSALYTFDGARFSSVYQSIVTDPTRSDPYPCGYLDHIWAMPAEGIMNDLCFTPQLYSGVINQGMAPARCEVQFGVHEWDGRKYVFNRNRSCVPPEVMKRALNVKGIPRTEKTSKTSLSAGVTMFTGSPWPFRYGDPGVGAGTGTGIGAGSGEGARGDDHGQGESAEIHADAGKFGAGSAPAPQAAEAKPTGPVKVVRPTTAVMINGEVFNEQGEKVVSSKPVSAPVIKPAVKVAPVERPVVAKATSGREKVRSAGKAYWPGLYTYTGSDSREVTLLIQEESRGFSGQIISQKANGTRETTDVQGAVKDGELLLYTNKTQQVLRIKYLRGTPVGVWVTDRWFSKNAATEFTIGD